MALSPTSSRGSSGSSGVSSFAKQGDTQITGDVTISGGSGVTLTEAGQNVAIAATGSAPLTVDSVKTADFTAAAGTYYPVDLTSGNVTATLPAAPADATQVAVQRNIGASNTLTVAAGAGDTIGAGSPTSLPVVGDTVVYVYKASTKIWYGANVFLPNLTAADASAVVGGTAQAPTVRTGTLDVIATQHAPAADWSNNSHKITAVTAGAAAGEAAIYDQTPAGIVTATGDVIYASGAHTAARLAVGATGQVLGVAAGIPAWQNLTAVPLPSFRSGRYTNVTANVGNGAGSAIGTNSMFVMPFMVTYPITVVGIGINVNSTVATAVARLGIYADGGAGIPTTLVVDAGTVDCHTSTGFVEATVSTSLTPGLYWIAVVGQTAAPNIYTSLALGGMSRSTGAVASSFLVPCYQIAGVSGALPSPAGTVADGQGQVPYVTIRI